MADAEKKGMELLAQAEKKAKAQGGLLGSIFGGLVLFCFAVFSSSKWNSTITAIAWRKLEIKKHCVVCIFSGSSRMEEAAELYVRAANSFKMAKKWSGKIKWLINVFE